MRGDYRDDGDREPAIRLDVVHQTLNGKSARHLGRSANCVCRLHLLRNLAGAFRGISNRSPGTTLGHRHRRFAGGRGLDRVWLLHHNYGLYIWYAIGGIGAGAVYGGCTGNVLKSFAPDHRGLCAGIVSGAYGIGTAVTIAPIEKMIFATSYQHAFIFWGYVQGIIVAVAAIFIVAPPKGWFPKNFKPLARVPQSIHDSTWWEMIKQPSFYMIYIMMTLVAFGGLVVTAQLKPIAAFYKVDKVIVAWGLSATILAIQLNRIVNGLTRPCGAGFPTTSAGRTPCLPPLC